MPPTDPVSTTPIVGASVRNAAAGGSGDIGVVADVVYETSGYRETFRGDTTNPAPRRRRASLRQLSVAAVAVVIVGGLGWIVSRQGWAVTASQVHEVAATVKDTTAAVTGASTDAAVTAKAKAALALSKRVFARDISVDTTKAVTTLTGTVASADAKELAGRIVADTSGVGSVRNLLAIDPSIRPEQERARLARRVNDLETQTGLSDAIQDSADLDGAKVKVRVTDGSVTLSGTVTSERQKARAEGLALTFPGVQQLNSKLVQKAVAPAP